MGLARDAEAHVRGQALPLFRRPRPDDAGRDRDQQCARRDRRGARARRLRPRASAARRSAAPCTTARSSACRCATPAISTATGSRWSACGWWGREVAPSLIPLNGRHAKTLRSAVGHDPILNLSSNGVHPHVRIRLGRADRHAARRDADQFRPRAGSVAQHRHHHQGALRPVQLPRRHRLRHAQDDRQGQARAHFRPGAGLAVLRRHARASAARRRSSARRRAFPRPRRTPTRRSITRPSSPTRASSTRAPCAAAEAGRLEPDDRTIFGLGRRLHLRGRRRRRRRC